MIVQTEMFWVSERGKSLCWDHVSWQTVPNLQASNVECPTADSRTNGMSFWFMPAECSASQPGRLIRGPRYCGMSPWSTSCVKLCVKPAITTALQLHWLLSRALCNSLSTGVQCSESLLYKLQTTVQAVLYLASTMTYIITMPHINDPSHTKLYYQHSQ